MSTAVNFQMIKEAQQNLAGIIKKTDLLFAESLSAKTGVELHLKLENLQKSGSFKIRGAYNKMLHLTEAEKRNGVVASSAGNHAQGVAISATHLGIKSTIVMPKNAPFAKISATRNNGAEVILAGNIYDEAYAQARKLKASTGATFVHPFNDPYVIAGQGTIGVEMLEAQPDLEVIFVPIGGGGIAAGVALAVKTINPAIKVIGVQAENAPSMYEAVQADKIETVAVKRTIADGIAVARPGDMTFPIIQKYVDEIVTVSETELSEAFLFLLENCNLVCEGAGAVSVAALLAYADRFKGQKVGAILSGGNIDINMIESIINHALVATGRRTQIKTAINHQPGELTRLLSCISDNGGNVLSTYQNRNRKGLSMYQMGVTVVLETIDAQHKAEILNELNAHGYEFYESSVGK
ncbi:MAG: threonine ammonia-lyase [Turicibacter sp.]|nr:threonine ammonia-lyase [Turicibacter sp.]